MYKATKELPTSSSAHWPPLTGLRDSAKSGSKKETAWGFVFFPVGALSLWEGINPGVSTLLRTLQLFTYVLLIPTNPVCPLTPSAGNSVSPLLAEADLFKLLTGGG